jgi:hypothetical protein
MKKIVDINSLVPNLAPLGKVSLFAPTWIILNQKGEKILWNGKTLLLDKKDRLDLIKSTDKAIKDIEKELNDLRRVKTILINSKSFDFRKLERKNQK